MWIFPDEYAKIFEPTVAAHEKGDNVDMRAVIEGVDLVNGSREDGDTAEDGTIADLGDSKGEEQAMGDDSTIDAGDGGDLIEVTAKDLAQRCLEIVGEEVGLFL